MIEVLHAQAMFSNVQISEMIYFSAPKTYYYFNTEKKMLLIITERWENIQ